MELCFLFKVCALSDFQVYKLNSHFFQSHGNQLHGSLSCCPSYLFVLPEIIDSSQTLHYSPGTRGVVVELVLAGGKHSRWSVLKAGQGCLIENMHGISAEKVMPFLRRYYGSIMAF